MQKASMTDYQDFTHDMDEFWQEAGMPVEARMTFNYPDREGASGSWVVHVHAFTNDRENPLLRGHCLLHYDMRTFAIRDITKCSEAFTGKPIANVLEHLHDLYKRTPAYAFDTIVYNNIDTLRALLYIMQCSGLAASRQLGVLTKICRHLGRDPRISNRLVAPLVVRYQNASEQAFLLVVRRLEKKLSNPSKDGFLKLANRIASYWGETQPAARGSLDHMARSFGKRA
jgi:hypothetical protein